MGDVSAGKILNDGYLASQIHDMKDFTREHNDAIEDAATLDRVAERLLTSDLSDDPLPARHTLETYWRERTQGAYQIAAWTVDERRRLIDAAKEGK